MENKSKFTIKSIVAIGIGAALFFVLGRFVSIPTPIPNTTANIQYGVLSVFGIIFGPAVSMIAGFIGHTLLICPGEAPGGAGSLRQAFSV